MVDSKQQWKAWLLLLPAIVLLLIFTVWPIINTVRIAFLVNYSPLEAQTGATFPFGFTNFVTVLKYGQSGNFFDGVVATLNCNGGKAGLIGCLTNTIILTLLTVPISCFLALLISVFLNSIPKFSKVFQTIYFLPYVTNSIAIGMVFAMMFNIVGLQNVPVATYNGNLEIYNITTRLVEVTQMVNGEPTKVLVEEQWGQVAQSWGIINNVIQFFGGQPTNWINAGSEYWPNIAVLTIYIVWNALPFKILILLGGLQSVNKQYYDAAKIDGASKVTVFGRITVPLLSPMIAYVVITSFIGGFKEYSSIVGIFNETMGPAGQSNRLNTMVGYIYSAMDTDNYGTASASAIILFIVILLITLLNLYVSNKKVHY